MVRKTGGLKWIRKSLICVIASLFLHPFFISMAFGAKVLPASIQNPNLISKGLPEYNVRHEGAVGDGLTDDTKAIQRALNKATETGGTVYFPKGRYLVKTVQVNGNNVKLLGDHATLVSNHNKYQVKYDADVVRQRSILNTDLAKQTILYNIQYEQDIKQGQMFLQFPRSVDMSVLRPNDLVMITTVKGDPWAPTYKYGSLRYITSVDKKKRTITLDDGIETTLKARKGNKANDDIKLFVYRPMQNFQMEGLTFELKENGRQNCVYIDFVKNAKIKDVRFIGKGQNLTGISISGFNIEIDHIFAEGFLSNELEIGYAVNVAGNNIKVHDSTFINGKHAISGADRRYRNNNFEYYNNTVIDPQSAALEAHGTGENIRIHDNTIRDVGKTYAGCGIWARGRHYQIYNNTITGVEKRVPGSSCGIKIIESAINDISILHNRVSNVTYGFLTDLWTGAEGNIKVIDNTFSDVDTGVFIKNLHHSVIAENNIAAQYNGIISIAGNDLSIARNTVRYEKDFGLILQEDSKFTSVTKGININNNTFTPGISANNIIRIQQKYDYVTITENKFNTFFNAPSFMKINTLQASDLSHATINNNQDVFFDPSK